VPGDDRTLSTLDAVLKSPAEHVCADKEPQEAPLADDNGRRQVSRR